MTIATESTPDSASETEPMMSVMNWRIASANGKVIEMSGAPVSTVNSECSLAALPKISVADTQTMCTPSVSVEVEIDHEVPSIPGVNVVPSTITDIEKELPSITRPETVGVEFPVKLWSAGSSIEICGEDIPYPSSSTILDP